MPKKYYLIVIISLLLMKCTNSADEQKQIEAPDISKDSIRYLPKTSAYSKLADYSYYVACLFDRNYKPFTPMFLNSGTGFFYKSGKVAYFITCRHVMQSKNYGHSANHYKIDMNVGGLNLDVYLNDTLHLKTKTNIDLCVFIVKDIKKNNVSYINEFIDSNSKSKIADSAIIFGYVTNPNYSTIGGLSKSMPELHFFQRNFCDDLPLLEKVYNNKIKPIEGNLKKEKAIKAYSKVSALVSDTMLHGMSGSPLFADFINHNNHKIVFEGMMYMMDSTIMKSFYLRKEVILEVIKSSIH